MKRGSRSGPILWCLLLLPSWAAPETWAGSGSWRFAGGATAIGQLANDDRVEDEAGASVDLFLETTRGKNRLQLYFEGSTRRRTGGIATRLVEANADAGSALGSDGGSRIQLSELKLARALADGSSIEFGLLDPTVYLDSSLIANDENLQFLGSSFVNNPTIEFPDYTLGLVHRRPERGRRPRMHIVLSSSNGLADNPDRSYSQLMDLGVSGKGIFFGAQAGIVRDRRINRLGLWLQTADHSRLDGGPGERPNFGAYSVSEFVWSRTFLSLRMGVANPEVSAAAAFLGVAVRRESGSTHLGAAASRSWASSEIPGDGVGDTSQFEVYFKLRIAGRLFVTQSVQRLVNSGFDAADDLRPSRVTLVALRLHTAF